MKFQNRKEAGQKLAEKLQDYKNNPDVLVLALPRGGVPVALEISRKLNVTMDIFLVRKIGFPGHEEYAMGAMAEGNVIIWNEDIDNDDKISQETESTIAKEKIELKRRSALYRKNKAEIDVQNKTIILVDDGIATGSTMIAAIRALRKKGASYIVVAIPIGPIDTYEKLNLADKVICLDTVLEFFGVGQFYENFDQLEDKEVILALKEAEKFGVKVDPVIKLIKENSTSLKNYDEIINQAKNKRFVLIGESSHGTEEFYHIRAEITKILITKFGFNAVAIEADWPDAFKINNYVKNNDKIKNADEALNDFKRFPIWMWRNKEISNFIEWLHDYNLKLDKKSQSHSTPISNSKAIPKVGFYGFDLYSLNSSIEMVIKYLNKIDPKAAAAVKYRYDCFEIFNNDPQTYGRAAGLGLTEDCEEKVIAGLKELQQQKFDLIAKGMNAEDFFSAEQNAHLIQNAEKYYRAMFKGRPSSWNIRDTHMTNTIDAINKFLLQNNKESKIVVWAHNSHLGDATATDMAKRGEINVGSLMRERHAKETLIIGFSTYQGTVTAADEWDEPEHYKVMNPALEESYEALFHKVGSDFILDLNKNSKLRKLLEIPRLERFIGVIYDKENERWSHYYQCDITKQYDFIIHIDKTSAIHPLNPNLLWTHAAKEDLDTYPSGL